MIVAIIDNKHDKIGWHRKKLKIKKITIRLYWKHFKLTLIVSLSYKKNLTSEKFSGVLKNDQYNVSIY